MLKFNAALLFYVIEIYFIKITSINKEKIIKEA